MIGHLRNWQSMSRDERYDAVRKLTAEGMSALQIATQFEGVSRNAICGIWSRMRDAGDPGAKAKAVRTTPKKVRQPKQPKEAHERCHKSTPQYERRQKGEPPRPPFLPPPVEVLPPPDCAPVLLMDTVARQCRWPLWRDDERPSPSEMFMCGAPTHDETYCPYHARASRGEGTPSERKAVKDAERVAA